MVVKAILLDYIGTLVEPRNYSLPDSKLSLHRALCQAGLVTNLGEFMDAYANAHEKHRVVRYEKLREVTNAVWVSEALNSLGCDVTVEDSRLKSALNLFFQDFIDSLEFRPCAKKLVKMAAEQCKVGLVSNFTCAAAIYASLRHLRIDQFFDAIVVSESVGWRKPHNIIFDEALRMLHVGPQEAVFIGDSPLEDIEGAKRIGLWTVFVSSRFNTLADLEKLGTKPDLVIQNLGEICEKLHELNSLFMTLGHDSKWAASKQGLNKKPF